MSWLKRLKNGLTKTSSNFSLGLNKVFSSKKLDQETLDQFEELLIKSDLGVELAMELTSALSKEKFGKETNETEIKQFLQQHILKIFEPLTNQIKLENKPTVFVFSGVNGNGKTTTLGKIAANFQQSGKKVLIAACDTFRAAAEDQLNVWANRAGVEIIRGTPQQDPASVAYMAVEKAYNEGYDVVLIDTAGRLHNKVNLMDELSKIYKVIAKVDGSAPHYSLLVLDATTGNNALEQMKSFHEKVKIDGFVITKLDGTARGGIAVALAKKFHKPIFYVGVGEAIDDLGVFDAQTFVESLLN